MCLCLCAAFTWIAECLCLFMPGCAFVNVSVGLCLSQRVGARVWAGFGFQIEPKWQAGFFVVVWGTAGPGALL